MTDERQRIFGITGGADDYIQKPFHTDYVKIKIIHLLQERQKLRERLLEKLRDNKLLLSEPEKVESIDDAFLRKFAEQIEAVYADPEARPWDYPGGTFTGRSRSLPEPHPSSSCVPIA